MTMYILNVYLLNCMNYLTEKWRSFKLHKW